MNTEVFSVFGRIAMDTSQVGPALASATHDTSSAESTLKGILGKIGKYVATAFSVKEVINFGKQCVETAAEVQASKSQYEQTFGVVKDFADKAIARVSEESGILETRLQGTASQIYAFAKSSGADSTEAMMLMEDSLRATADAAAYYDRSLEDTAETLQSFLKGNFANDAALGVSATENTRNAKAMELFGQKYNDLTEIQKQQTLLKMVTDAQKLSGAMGQAQRESDGWENVMGNLKESWKQFQAVVGAPILQAIIPVIKQLTEGMSGLGGNAETLGTIFTNFLTPLLSVGQSVVPVILDLIQSILPLLLNVIDMIVPPISEIIGGLLPVLVSILQPILQLIMPILNLLTPILNLVTSLLQPIAEIVNIILPVLIGFLEPLIDLIVKIITPILNIVQEALTPLLDVIVMLISTLMEILQPILDVIIESLGTVLEPLLSALMPIMETILMALSPLLSALTSLLSLILKPLILIIKEVAEAFSKVLKSAIESVTPIIESLTGWFTNLITFITDVFKGNWSAVWDDIVQLFKDYINSIPVAFQSVINMVITLLNGMIDSFNDLTGIIGIEMIPNIPKVNIPPILAEGGILEKGQVGLLEGNGAEAVVPLENNRKWISAVANDMENAIKPSVADDESKAILKDILKEMKEMNTGMYENMVDALVDGVKWNFNNREFARMVKVVN